MTEPVELRYAGPGVAGEPPIPHRWWLVVTTVVCLAATGVPIGDGSILLSLVNLLRSDSWSDLLLYVSLAVVLPPIALPMFWIAWLRWPLPRRKGVAPRVVAMALAGLLAIGPLLAAFVFRGFYGRHMPYLIGLIAVFAIELTVRCVQLIGRVGWRLGVLAMFLSAYCVAVMMVGACLTLLSEWRGVVLFSIPLVAVLVELRLLWRSAARTFP